LFCFDDREDVRMRRTRSSTLVVVGLLLLASTFAVSAALTPSRDVVRDADGAEQTPTAEPVADGDVLVAIQGGGPRWQENGRLYRLDDGQREWQIADRDSYFDVTPLANGSVVAGFHQNGYESGCEPYDAPCTKTGFRVIDPGNGTPTVQSAYTFPVRTPTHREVHDVDALGPNSFVFSDMDRERIAVVENGSLVWEWRAAESGFYDVPPDPTTRDWLHINDVDHLGDGRFLVSVRNANQLLIVERGEGIVEVINEDRSDANDETCTVPNQLQDFDGDGEVRCGDPSVLNHQHNPQWLGNGTVLVADSENDRIVELRRVDGRYRPQWSLAGAGGIGLDWPRDADRLSNGNTLVTDSLNRRVFVVSPDGEVVWSYGTDLIPYEADDAAVGEPVAPSYANASVNESAFESPETTGGPRGDDVPGVSLLLVGIRAVFPRLPIWFAETQLLLTLVSLGLVTAGGVGRARE
jgi:hypothetical protein